MTLEQAEEKYCPFMFGAPKSVEWENMVCLENKCMSWEWTEHKDIGYCKLIEKENK